MLPVFSLALLAAFPLASQSQALSPVVQSGEAPSSQPTTWKPSVDLGAGIRIGFGEPSYATAGARVAFPTSSNTSISLRPSLIFGNTTSSGERNNQTQVVVPLTLDLFTNKTVSAYLGPGLAYNVDSDNQTNASLHAGVDIKLNQRLRFSTGLTYVFQQSDRDNRDLEANALLYFRL